MKERVLRLVRPAAAGMSLLVCAAVALMWGRSYWSLDIVSYVREDGSTRAVASRAGGIHYVAAGTRARARGMQRDSYRIPPGGADEPTLHFSASLLWRRMGFAHAQTTTGLVLTPVIRAPRTAIIVAPGPGPERPLIEGQGSDVALATTNPAAKSGTPRPAAAAPARLAGAPPAMSVNLVPWLGVAPYDEWVVPYWAAALPAAVYPSLRAAHALRRRRRRRRGLCCECGYDLRGSPGRCPECGAAAIA